MSQRNKRVLRAFQKYFLTCSEQIRFKTSHISYGGKISLAGVAISGISLFQSWIYGEESIVGRGVLQITSASSFSPLVGYIGVLLSLILGGILFSIVSLKRKEKLYFLGFLRLQESSITFYGGIALLILSLQTFLFISGLKIYSTDIFYGKGITLCIMGSIFILIGSFSLKKEYRKNIKGSYMSEARGNEYSQSMEEEKKNMKLPF